MDERIHYKMCPECLYFLEIGVIYFEMKTKLMFCSKRIQELCYFNLKLLSLCVLELQPLLNALLVYYYDPLPFLYYHWHIIEVMDLPGNLSCVASTMELSLRHFWGIYFAMALGSEVSSLNNPFHF